VVRAIKINGLIEGVAISPDGSMFCTGSSVDDRVDVWAVSPDNVSLVLSLALQRRVEYVAGPTFSPASDKIAFATGNQLCLLII
jgi:hypothetical protein